MNVAWEINPLSPELYMNLGSLYLRDPGRYRKEAIALLERAAHFYPDNPNHWNNLGYLYSLEGNFSAAEDAYGKALLINPDMGVAESNLNNALRHSNHPRPKVLVGLDELRALQGLIVKGDYSPKTLALAEKVSADLPEAVKAHFFYGSLLLANGRVQESISPLEWVVAHEPRNVTAWANLGAAYSAGGRTDDAVRALKTALSIDPQNAPARQRLQAMGIAP